jgi:hypothetical protein
MDDARDGNVPNCQNAIRINSSVLTSTQRFAIEPPLVVSTIQGGGSRVQAWQSGRSPYRHHAEPGVEAYVDVQDQVAGPSGKRAKFCHGPCCNWDAGFNFDPQVIAVAEEMFLHRPECLD